VADDDGSDSIFKTASFFFTSQAASMNQAAIAKGHVVFSKGPFSPLPWIDSTFNKILLVNVAYFFDSDGQDMAEVYRVLRLGGGGARSTASAARTAAGEISLSVREGGIGGLRPPFFSRTPMLCIGYAKSVPDQGLFLSIDRNSSPVFASRSHPLPQRGEGITSAPTLFLTQFDLVGNLV
jgi:hypothetical protein